MPNKSIWGAIKTEPAKLNLLKKLKEQAALLADETQGLLYAEVEPVDAADTTLSEPVITYSFYVYAPYLGNYRNRFFSIVDKKSNYIVVDQISHKRYDKLKTADDVINNIEESIAKGEAGALIKDLYASSEELKK